MKTLLLKVSVVMFAVIVLIGMITFANFVASEFTNHMVSVLVFFVVLGAEVGSLIGYAYALEKWY